MNHIWRTGIIIGYHGVHRYIYNTNTGISEYVASGATIFVAVRITITTTIHITPFRYAHTILRCLPYAMLPFTIIINALKALIGQWQYE